MSGFDLLIATSVNDGFGRSLVEAMLLGIPVIASNSGGHREIIKDGKNGYLVPPDDIETFVIKSLELLDNKAMIQTLTARAHKDAINRFTVERHVSSIMKIYSQIVNK